MSKSSNNLVNPNAREAMNRFKMEAASEVDVPDTTKNYTKYHLFERPACFCGKSDLTYQMNCVASCPRKA